MEMSAKQSCRDKAASWRARKEEIGLLISRGLELSQIEEELQKDGSRMTAQVREYIIWEMRSPEVRELLAQGFDVDAAEEKMRLNGWIWTDTLRKKALWEFHREEIIELYKSLRSVEAVREIMAKKGFTPQTRIYYEWLRCWGISTNINRNSFSEMDAWLHESPFGSDNSATPRSVIGPCHEYYGPAALKTSHSSLTDMVGNSNGNLLQDPSHLVTLVAQNGKGHVNVYEPGGGLMDVDEEHKLGVLSEPLHMDMRIANSVTSPRYPRKSQASTQCPRSNQYILRPTSAHYGSSLDEYYSDNSDEAFVAHRTPADSGYASKTSSMQSAQVECLHASQSAGNLRNVLSQKSKDKKWTAQNNALYSVSCSVDHQGMDFNFHCCGSSCLQDLAFLAAHIPSQQVYERLCSYMRCEDVRRWDQAGNTFLHKLAVTGAPWAYFEASLKAQIDPCHRNAYGQTFAHVLNVSAFHDNLMECLASLQGQGVDFSLRDASGRTILHCLYGQPISPRTAREILKLIEVPGRQLSLRDVSGRTPSEIFKHTFLQQASTNPRWSNPELQLQMLGILEDIVDDRVLRLNDQGVDWPMVTDNSDDLRATLQSQYKEVIDKAKNGIVVEAVDGSNAFHAQAALMTIHDAATDLGILKKLISVGIDTNDYDKAGRTPLEATITLPRDYETELTTSEKVCLLIDKGKANIHSRNRLGHTPLYSAAIRGLDRTVEVLLLRGSHVNIRANGQSLLDAVTDACHRAFVEYCESGYCRYHEAQCSRIEACKVLLVRYGAVSNPTQAQSMGYPVLRCPSSQ